MQDFYPRWQKESIKQALKTRRVILLSGARQCGKTTLAKQIASPNATYLTLDDLTLKQAAESDPHNFVKHQENLLIIDEVQRVPTLLPAIKKVVDEDTRPGQYLLTGSANIQSLPGVQESLAGRIRKIRLRPLSQGELQGRLPHFFEKAFNESFTNIPPCERDTLLEYAFRGGFPEALTLKEKERRQWHKDYLDALIERDLKDITKIHRYDAMQELIRILSAWSSKFMDVSAIGRGLSIQRPTVESYMNALEALYLIERVKPWTKTDYGRVGKQTKVFMADCGLMASILGWQLEQVKLDSDRLGKLIETFVFNELASHIDASNGQYQLFHYRDREKREIDFLIERDDHLILGLEVKASSTVGANDFKHLKWFQANMLKEDNFIGLVLYAGERAMSFGPHLWALPFNALWS
jgi:predicted AAA+ superfamily ATPase